MREHPIPQDITGYSFHIVGNMTIKQFAEVLVGTIIALIIYNANLVSIIKYPLAIFFFLLGGAFAFVPIEERPIDHWVFTFFKSIYKPTQFFWKKTPKIPDVFFFTPNKQSDSIIKQIDISPIKKQRAQEYLSINTTPIDTTIDELEKSKIQNILQTFDSVLVIPTVESDTPHQPKIKPNLTIRTRKITKIGQSNAVTPPSNMPPSEKQTANFIDQTSNKIDNLTEEIISQQNQQQSYLETTINSSNNNLDQVYYTQATTNSSLPFPKPPTTANTLVGMVIDQNNSVVPEATIEICNQQKTIIAVTTNALGQFFVKTPLEDGYYLIRTSKDGYSFQEYGIELKQSLIDPIEIKAY